MRFPIAIARHDRPHLGRSPLVTSVTLMCPSHQRRRAGVSAQQLCCALLQLGRNRAPLHCNTGRQSPDLHCSCPLSPRYDMATTSHTCHTESAASFIGTAWSTSTLLSTCKCRLGHSLLVALRSASTNPQVPAGFLQQTDTTNRHRITTGREGTQRHTTRKQLLQSSRSSQQRVHYRTNQMIQCIVPVQRQI